MIRAKSIAEQASVAKAGIESGDIREFMAEMGGGRRDE
jgi:hypothetical protein